MTVTPKDAATVVILRPAPCKAGKDFEVLMALRSSRSDFVPGSYVFPGGRVDDEDGSDAMMRFVDDAGWNAIRDRHGRSVNRVLSPGIWIAAIRETFEELGLLFAMRRGTTSLVTFDSPESVRRYRDYGEALRSGRISFSEILDRENLSLALDRLHFFAHWITPELMPKRYDTRFFVAIAPAGQEALHDGNEMTNHRWISPGEALEGYRRNNFHMVVPTIVTLEELCRFDRPADVIEAAGSKKIDSVLTRLVFEDGEVQEHAPDGRIFRNLVAPR